MRRIATSQKSGLPAIGERLPELLVFTAASTRTSVAKHLGSRGTLLDFVHGTWCPGCVSQLYGLQRHRQEFEKLGAKILVVTRDLPEILAAFLVRARPALEYAVLADPHGSAHQRIGAGGHTMLLVVDGDRIVRRLGHWRDGSESLGYQSVMSMLREAGHRNTDGYISATGSPDVVL